jgi:PAS domain-containing protein
MSEQAFRNYGLPPDAPRTREALIERLHPDDRERMVAEGDFARTRAGPFEVEGRVIWPDGQVRTLAIAGETVLDARGRLVRVMTVNRDVTDEKNAEAALRESEQRFRLIADSAPVALWITRADGEREFVSWAFADFLGLPVEEARVLDWSTRVHQDDRSRVLTELAYGEASRRPFSIELRSSPTAKPPGARSASSRAGFAPTASGAGCARFRDRAGGRAASTSARSACPST